MLAASKQDRNAQVMEGSVRLKAAPGSIPDLRLRWKTRMYRRRSGRNTFGSMLLSIGLRSRQTGIGSFGVGKVIMCISYPFILYQCSDTGMRSLKMRSLASLVPFLW